MPEVGFALLLSCAIAVIIGAATWLITRLSLHPIERGTVPRLVASLVFVFAWILLYVLAVRSADERVRMCSECGRSAWTVAIFGWTSAREPALDTAHSPYEKAFADVIGSHRHRWHADDLVASKCREWFQLLPSLSDRELARAWAAKWRSWPEDVRLQTWECFSAGIGRTYAPYSRTESPDARFEAWRKRWSSEHPQWQ